MTRKYGRNTDGTFAQSQGAGALFENYGEGLVKSAQ